MAKRKPKHSTSPGLPPASAPEPVTTEPSAPASTEASGVPGSWRAAIEAAVKLGVPAVIAMGVIWWMAMMLTTRLDRIIDRMDAHDKSTAELVTHLNADAAQSWRLVAISQRICINTAKTDQERISCVTEAPR